MRSQLAQARRMHQTVDPDSIDSSPGHQQAMHVSLSSSAKKDARIRSRRFYNGHMNGPRGHRFTPKVTPGSASVNIKVGRPQLISSRIHIAQIAHGHMTPCRMRENARGQLQNTFYQYMVSQRILTHRLVKPTYIKQNETIHVTSRF